MAQAVGGDGAGLDGGAGDEGEGGGGDEGLYFIWKSRSEGEKKRKKEKKKRLTANMGRMRMGSTVGMEALGSPCGRGSG